MAHAGQTRPRHGSETRPAHHLRPSAQHSAAHAVRAAGHEADEKVHCPVQDQDARGAAEFDRPHCQCVLRDEKGGACQL